MVFPFYVIQNILTFPSAFCSYMLIISHESLRGVYKTEGAIFKSFLLQSAD